MISIESNPLHEDEEVKRECNGANQIIFSWTDFTGAFIVLKQIFTSNFFSLKHTPSLYLCKL